jgi:hypothetical protein
MTPERFFMVALPQRISQSLKEFAGMSGKITVRLDKERVWTIQFGNVSRPIIPRPAPNTDLYLRFSEEAFAEFLAGRIDFQSRLESGDLKIRGNTGLMTHLVRLLSPPTSPLGARLGTF